jgi:hypothetical protein
MIYKVRDLPLLDVTSRTQSGTQPALRAGAIPRAGRYI